MTIAKTFFFFLSTRFVSQRQGGGPEYSGEGAAHPLRPEAETETGRRGRHAGQGGAEPTARRQEDQRLLQTFGEQSHQARRGQEPLLAATLSNGNGKYRTLVHFNQLIYLFIYLFTYCPVGLFN